MEAGEKSGTINKSSTFNRVHSEDEYRAAQSITRLQLISLGMTNTSASRMARVERKSRREAPRFKRPSQQ